LIEMNGRCADPQANEADQNRIRWLLIDLYLF